MSTSIDKLSFKGKFSKELSSLQELMEKLWSEHGVSFVKAGDERVYAFGGNKSVIVFDESKWHGTIEMATPKGIITIKPEANGEYLVTGNNLDDESLKTALVEGTDEIRKYYDNRYWNANNAAS
ncbi:MAG: hypothetical protein AB1757_19370 [Acidobacteriota bacterium]